MKRNVETRSVAIRRAKRKDTSLKQISVDDWLTIRAFEQDDTAAVRALFITVNRQIAPPHLAVRFEHYIERALREEIDIVASYYAARSGRFFVATAADELVGMFGFELAEPGVAELRRMYVNPQFRRRGLGSNMLTRAETEVRNAGYTRLILSTSELQTAALALYRNAGYHEVRQEFSKQATNKTLGGEIRRFHFEKNLLEDR